MSLWLAGEAGQVSLARSAGRPGIGASVDQHAAAIRDALGGRLSVGALLSYAQGFIEAAVARGWWPRGSGEGWEPGDDREPGDDGELGPRLDWEPEDCEPELERETGLDWESLQLAAVCRLVLEVQGLGM